VKNTVTKFLVATSKIVLGALLLVLLLLYLLPIVFPGTIGDKVKHFANQQLTGETNFSKLRLSFFSHFPSFTVSLYDFSLKGSAPFSQDTLVAAKELAMGLNLRSLIFNNKIHIDEIYLDGAHLNVQVDKTGAANYNVYQPAPDSSSDTANTALKLEKISITNSRLMYNDASLPLQITAQGLNYSGKGDLSKAIFDLKSNIAADAFSLQFDGEQYLSNKKLNAELITQINTRSLSFIFSKNKVKLNKLPIIFNGKLDFLSNGYNVYLSVGSPTCTLEQLAGLLPPQYAGWQKETQLKGNVNFSMKCQGKYIAATQTMPSLQFNLQLREGFIAHNNAQVPLSNISLVADVKMPGLNADSLQVHITPLSFAMGADYCTARWQTTGLLQPYIDADVQARLNLEKFKQALGLAAIDIKGNTNIAFSAKGRYRTGPNPASIRHENTVLSIPVFKLDATIQNGYLKYAHLPQSISNIGGHIVVACTDGNFLNSSLLAENINATALDNFIKGSVKINGLDKVAVDANFATHLNLAALRQMIPMQQLELAGMLDIAVNSKGEYEPDKKIFPITTADIVLKDGRIKTGYYPNAISNIQIQAKAVNTGTGLQTQSLSLQPVSFVFEEQPFTLQAQLHNFENIAYQAKLDGVLDIGRIYKVFKQDSLQLSGHADMHLTVKGTQNAALKQQYHLLHNEGTLAVKNIAVSSYLLPLSLQIKEGRFRLVNDKMWFSRFLAQYGSSDIALNGYLQDAIGWYFTPGATLKGKLALESKNFNADEWMVFADTSHATKNSEAADSGVIAIPANWDVEINAAVRQLQFNGIKASNANATLKIADGALLLQQAGLELAGSKTVLNARYKNTALNKAIFEMDIDASEFDIKRMYDSVKLFRDMAFAAANASGIVSLQYKLKGRLGNGMQPVYPSLDGGGVLKVKDVKVNRFKLFNAVSRRTGKDSMANPNIKEVNIISRVKNNVITLERFRIKSNGFRIRIAGQSNFDGALRLRMRLGLPPLGIFGIPINVSGTTDNPRIRLGKGNTDNLEEKEDEEQVPLPTNGKQ
jgi:AsmA protein